jgi:DNA-binding response OmpR family regulator
MRVLVADDDAVTARRLQGLAQSWGYEVVTVEDGSAALEALTGSDPPHLAVLDWVMPGLDGVDICKALRENPACASTYVILLTAKTSRGDIIEGFDAGADDYLVKPFDADELKGRLKAGARIVDLQERLASNVAELTTALATVRALHGMLPICSYCKAIRDDLNYWHQVEEYVSEHSDVTFSHGVCPKCLDEALERDASTHVD